jgi:uncharacterized protein (TIGR02001 family)
MPSAIRGRVMALRACGEALLSCAAFVALSVAAAADEAADAPRDLQVEFDVSLMSDYIYRGVSLSARKPSAATFVEGQWLGFFASTNVQNVTLPTSPAAEVTLTGGYRWETPDYKLELSANYFWYPGETLLDGMPATSYWEYAVGVERYFTGQITLKGLIAYSPNVFGTGAWGAYSEAGVEIGLPKLPHDIKWQLNATAGYWRFGNISPMLGGFPLPSYTNWRVGLEFNFNDHLSFDLSYWDTNLSKEDCFVFSGDTMATPGGVVNAISNPEGLRSRLCGATIVGTLSMKFDLSDFKR